MRNATSKIVIRAAWAQTKKGEQQDKPQDIDGQEDDEGNGNGD